MTQDRPISFIFSSDSARTGTAYGIVGAYIALAGSGGATAHFADSERASQVAIFQPATTILSRQTPTVQDEFDALQRLWQSAEVVHPGGEQDATQNKFELLVVEPEDLGHFMPTYGAPVKLRITGFEQGRFSPVEVDEVDLEIFDI